MINLKDCKIVDINTDCYIMSTGCPTCGYGGYSVLELDIFYDIGEKFTKEINLEGDFSYSDLMKIILSNIEEIKQMKRDQFEEWISEEVDKKYIL